LEEIARRVRRFVTALLVAHCVVENDLDALAPLCAHNSELSKAFHSSHEDKLEQCLRIVSSLPTTIPLLELMNIALPLALRRLKITWNDSPLELIERLQSEYKIKAAAKGLKVIINVCHMHIYILLLLNNFFPLAFWFALSEILP